MKLLTADQMREADRLTTERYGIAGLTLMDRAGTAVADVLREVCPDLDQRKIVILCGKGNNGGDGFVVARVLRERGHSPLVVLCADPESVSGDAAANLKRWRQSLGDLQVASSESEWDAARAALERGDVVVDALLGTGLRGPVTGLLARVIDDVNAARAAQPSAGARPPLVLAIDMPSGLGSDAHDLDGPVVAADCTVTFTAPKVGQLVSRSASCVGRLVVRQIGTPRELLDSDAHLKLHWLEPGEFRAMPLVRPRDSNKGTYGHALIVAGSVGKSGAAILSSRGALRAGAGLVTVATAAEALPTVAAGMPEVMTVPLVSTDAGTIALHALDYGRFAEVAAKKSVIAIGPGLSTNAETRDFVHAVVERSEVSLILDADGLNAYDGCADRLNDRKTPSLTLTPHPGEMARLLGRTIPEIQSRRLDTALEAANRWGAIVVLKGFHTIVAAPDGRAFVNTTGNPGMATGGTGDVLTGILAGLTAQFGVDDWLRVVGLGVYLHGLAGDIAAQRVGEIPLVAGDLIDALPAAFRQLLAERDRAC
ncbi:MAG: NAD(P)H-hydrate dehydratase [Candidatus Acidiferrales bacterium]